MIPPAPEQIPTLEADLFKNFIVTIIQLVGLIRALEALAVRQRFYIYRRVEIMYNCLGLSGDARGSQSV